MAQAENKTKPTDQAVPNFLAGVTDDTQRQDSETLCRLMTDVTGQPARMWGTIVGFGQYHYKYESGREADFLALGFAPRKGVLSVYAMDDPDHRQPLLDKLGSHKTGKGCIYIKRLSDVDMAVLRDLLHQSYAYVMAHDQAPSRP